MRECDVWDDKHPLLAAHHQHAEIGHEKQLVLNGASKGADAAAMNRCRYHPRIRPRQVDEAVDHVEHHHQTIV